MVRINRGWTSVEEGVSPLNSAVDLDDRQSWINDNHEIWEKTAATESTNKWNCAVTEPWVQQAGTFGLLYLVTQWKAAERRVVLRSMYAPFIAGSQFGLLFVVGHTEFDSEQQRICLEQQLYGDLLLLNCTENTTAGERTPPCPLKKN